MTLAEFLLARIAEDEASAQLATDGPWRVNDERYPEAIYSDVVGGGAVVSGERWGGEASIFDEPDDALHIARWNPARVLAECETKRHIVEECARWSEMDPYCSPIDMSSLIADEFLLLLAQPYADHPDYREEWRV